METSQQRFLKDPAGEEAQLVQGKWYHQEVPSWPQHLLTHPQVSFSMSWLSLITVISTKPPPHFLDYVNYSILFLGPLNSVPLTTNTTHMVLSPMCLYPSTPDPVVISRPLCKTQYLAHGTCLEKCMLISPSLLSSTLILIPYPKEAESELIGPKSLLLWKGTLIYYLGSGNKYCSILWS